jgi:cytochrome c551/c552
MKKIVIPFLGIMLFLACNPAAKTENGESDVTKEVKKETDEQKGIGKFKSVELGAALDQDMAKKGEELFELKCLSCHKLTEERVVGPGWKGVTTRRKPEWIMNFLTNVEQMLDKDPEAQAMLEVCLVRMPNQNLTETDARNALEFMRKNDGVK